MWGYFQTKLTGTDLLNYQRSLYGGRGWDLTAEARYLDAEDARGAKAGALIGVYKHINENVKFGLGYNFTDFDDDLTNQNYTSQGSFINLVGAM